MTQPRIAITGPDGFIAWHARCLARSRWGGDLVHIGREEYLDDALLDAALKEVDAIIHLAGVNRAFNEADITTVNPWLASRLVESLDRLGNAPTVVFGNSIHSLGDSPFGAAKRESGSILAAWAARSGASLVDVVLPNIFGEHGRPHYNSVVATFSHLVARGEEPVLIDDKELPLLHVQRAAEVLLDQAVGPTASRIEVSGESRLVSDVLASLRSMAAAYRTADLPDLSDPFTRDLFNTYRSATFPDEWPIYPQFRSDPRGSLAEVVRAAGGQSQVFFSTTNPGFTRGQHYHLHKVERFVVIQGEGVICLRRLFGSDVVEFPVSGDRPAIIDMPTMWVHSITNTGPGELITLFYADEMFDPDRPDTYPEEV